MSSLSSRRRHRFTTDWPGRRLERCLERRPSAAMCMGVAAKVAATPRRADAIHLGRLVSRALQRGAAITTSRSWLSRNRTMFMSQLFATNVLDIQFRVAVSAAAAALGGRPAGRAVSHSFSPVSCAPHRWWQLVHPHTTSKAMQYTLLKITNGNAARGPHHVQKAKTRWVLVYTAASILNF